MCPLLSFLLSHPLTSFLFLASLSTWTHRRVFPKTQQDHFCGTLASSKGLHTTVFNYRQVSTWTRLCMKLIPYYLTRLSDNRQERKVSCRSVPFSSLVLFQFFLLFFFGLPILIVNEQCARLFSMIIPQHFKPCLQFDLQPHGLSDMQRMHVSARKLSGFPVADICLQCLVSSVLNPGRGTGVGHYPSPIRD